MVSNGADVTASSRDNAESSTEQVYRFIMPTLPQGKMFATSVFLHYDPTARPCRVEDLGEALDSDKQAVRRQHGSFPVQSRLAADAPRRSDEVRVYFAQGTHGEGSSVCGIIDPDATEVTVKLHWLPAVTPDATVKTALEPYGKVKSCARETWRCQGFEEIATTTRSVTIVLRDGDSSNSIPHVIHILGLPVLMSVPGRAYVASRWATPEALPGPVVYEM